MSPLQKKRLTLVLSLLVGLSLAVAFALYALQQNLNLFYSPTDIAQGKATPGVRISVGGLVVPGSVVRDTHDAQSLKVRFDLTDGAHQLTVHFDRILPDLFREGQGILAKGKLDSDLKTVIADEVLAKHDENYTPPEVVESLKKSGMWQHMDKKNSTTTPPADQLK